MDADRRDLLVPFVMSESGLCTHLGLSLASQNPSAPAQTYLNLYCFNLSRRYNIMSVLMVMSMIKFAIDLNNGHHIFTTFT